MTKFDNYTDAVCSALANHPKQQEVVARKQEILREVSEFHNFTPASVLYVGFTPSILDCRAKSVSVTEISDAAKEYLDQHKVKYTYIDHKNLADYSKKFDVVVALDEYFTFASSDQEQQDQIRLFCSLTKEFLISTLKDYKNQDFKDKEFSHPALIRKNNRIFSYLEVHDWDVKDRSQWSTMVHEISSPGNILKSWGEFQRRTMYFKQLAKFSHDAGAADFVVHRNLMYKSLIKKNYEHVISIRFDNGY
jgi:dsDNA-binding SOS-regulon protein